MNFNSLQYLVVLAQERNFARAAKRLFVVQPTLRQAIASLEHELGAQLFVRGSSPLALTPAGSAYVKWAQETLQSHSDTVQKVADLVGGTTKLTLAMAFSLTLIYVPQLVERFSKERPKCRLTIMERNSTNAQRELETATSTDIVVGTFLDPSPVLQVEDLAQEELMLALPRNHPLCPGPGQELDLSTLRDMPMIRLANSLNYGFWVSSTFSGQDFLPDTAMSSTGYNTMINMVAAGAGFTIAPRRFLEWRNDPNVAFFHIPHSNNYRTLSVAWRKDRYFNQDMASMVELLHQIIGEKNH